MLDPTWQQLTDLIQRHWGIQELRSLQEPALRASLSRRDSLVVLPTGGGKSLCFQAPALVREKPTVVISPLIALMKDQVDGLRASGIDAAHLNSTTPQSDKRKIADGLQSGKIKLLYVSPERMALDGFRTYLRNLGVDTFAVDEAHCISHWGHDFRPEYRQLGALKEWFPDATLHAYTATATEQVRTDIVSQLRLQQPEILVGDFDRPNLTYRVLPRERDVEGQLLQILANHRGAAGIVYVMRRADADKWSSTLRARGMKAIGYHAGMEPADRKRAQDQFTNEEADVVVATVAFGMGIDRSDVRFIIHLGMPKSIEQYQQEAGRAGRDGLPSECVLLHSAGDAMTWRKMFQKSVAEADPPLDPEFIVSSNKHLDSMTRFCRSMTCRHKALVEYFGQAFRPGPCQGCDVCLSTVALDPNSQETAQKILSCVARVNQSFGIKYVIEVLQGKLTAKVLQRGHEKLSTFGLLKESSDTALRTWIEQLIDQKLLDLVDNDGFPLLKLNAASWEVMRNTRQVSLVAARPERATVRSTAAQDGWDDVDLPLFEILRTLRKELASEQGVPPFVIFSDATLRDLSRVRPSSLEKMLGVTGIGQAKLDRYGDQFFDILHRHCRENNLNRDGLSARRERKSVSPKSASSAFEMFRNGATIPEVMERMTRAHSTVVGYLTDFILREKPSSIDPWVSPATYTRITDAATAVNSSLLKPIFEYLSEEVPYDAIRLVMAHMSSQGEAEMS